MQPSHLLYELYRCGINLLPEDRDYIHCMKVLKDPEAEDKAIDDICSAINSYFFKSTKWNSLSPKEFVMARCIENLGRDERINEDYDQDWMSVAWWRNKAGILKSKETSSTANFDKHDTILTHVNFF